jgi:hypothetical protein
MVPIERNTIRHEAYICPSVFEKTPPEVVWGVILLGYVKHSFLRNVCPRILSKEGYNS